MNQHFNMFLKHLKHSASMAKGLSEGISKHNLVVGFPDIPPPEQIHELIGEFAKKPDYQYQPTKVGLDTIKNVICLIYRENTKLDPNKNIILHQKLNSHIFNFEDNL